MPSDQSPLDPYATAARIQDLRQRVLDRVPVTPEEYREVIESLRRTRMAAALPQKKSKRGAVAFDTSTLEDL